jgi:hypothetical protein
MTELERIKKLVALVAIAFSWAHLIDEWLCTQKPLKIKKHGAKEKNIFQYGLGHLQHIFNEQREKFLQLGLKTCSEFCEHLIAAGHTALLPGESLLLPRDDFSVRCSFVDYDGGKVLSQWRANPPKTSGEEDEFIRNHCHLIVDGVKYIEQYITEIRKGNRPQHL